MTQTIASTLPAAPAKARFGAPLLIGGAVALAVGGAAAGYLMRGGEPELPASPVATARADAPAATATSQVSPAQPVDATPAKPAAKPAPVARTTPKPRPVQSGSESTRHADSTPLPTQRVATCADCGVVEAVRPVTRKGEGSGVGAVAGGVVGAVVGNQVGGGNGRKAMTVLGAIGGGLAGHEIEKRAKSETVYEVQVRMEDGSLRTVTQSTQPTPGSRVIVDGQSLRPASTQEPAPRLLKTSTGA
jgi:outer membrane lipoprotein SlyB